MSLKWSNVSSIKSKKYNCGYCDHKVASVYGYNATDHAGNLRRQIYICSECSCATFFSEAGQYPGVKPGMAVSNVPDDVSKLYDEARECIASSANTAAVLICRKLLMNLAVSQGAEEGKPFVSYVEYLGEKGFIPPNGKGWVDHIRQRGNEANHEIALMNAEQAIELVTFVEMLLKFIYEFPAKIPSLTDPK